MTVVLRAYAGMQPRDHPTDTGINNYRLRQRQPDPARPMAGDDLRREEPLLDHHIEELLDAISPLVDPPTTPT